MVRFWLSLLTHRRLVVMRHLASLIIVSAISRTAASVSFVFRMLVDLFEISFWVSHMFQWSLMHGLSGSSTLHARALLKRSRAVHLTNWTF